MDFALTEEQQMIVKSTREFVQHELYPHEQQIEQSGVLRAELHARAQGQGHRCRPVRGQHAHRGRRRGPGRRVSWVLYEKELGHTSYILHYGCVARPSNILLACEGEQRERYLLPAVRGERVECLAMTEPQAGSDMRSMKTSAVQQGGDFVINGTKHFISHADHADFVILFAATGEEQAPRGKRKLMTAFLVDKGTPGFEVLAGLPERLASRLHQQHPAFQRLPRTEDGGARRGAPGIRGRQYLARCDAPAGGRQLPRPSRARARATPSSGPWIGSQFGQQIGKFQGVAFKLADMAVELRAAELLTLEAAWKLDHDVASDMDMAIAKLKATEMLAMVADEALQIHGGMGLMTEMPLERIWRDARIERIWDGTSEVQRHIISRALLRPLGG